MSKNVFDQLTQVNNDINRNSFDWSHQNSFTSKLGYIYPLMAELVPANTKFKCRAHLGLQFMPLMYPVQTRMKARVSFFKVPIRTLWKDYRDYVGGFRNDIEEPYLDSTTSTSFDNMFGKCQLGDYLNIPNVIYNGENGGSVTLTTSPNGLNKIEPFVLLNDSGDIVTSINEGAGISLVPYNSSTLSGVVESNDYVAILAGRSYQVGITQFRNNINYTIDNPITNSIRFYVNSKDWLFGWLDNPKTLDGFPYIFFLDENSQIVYYKDISDSFDIGGYSVHQEIKPNTTDSIHYWEYSFNGSHNIVFRLPSHVDTSKISKIFIGSVAFAPVDDMTLPKDEDLFASLDRFYNGFNSSIKFSFPEQILSVVPGQEGEYTFITPETTPYYSSVYNKDGLKLKAYKARAYEAIYNGYIRDMRNNPFYVNGKLTYNEWIPNNNGGADKYPYKLHRANWEKDMFTTAVSSPQQGKAPLVGLTSYISNDEVNGEISYNISLVDEDGKKYRVNFETTDGTGVVKIGEVLPENTPVSSISYTQLINDNINYGFTIPDLRVVNAYQKYLELNQRKGYSYKDIIEGRFDVNVKYDDLLLPEFIGGYTRDINMNRVVQSVDQNFGKETSSYDGALGSLAGDAFLSSGDVPEISTFCDEESIIMCIMSVVPVANYSQVLPKDYLYNDILDHFQPEFNNLGFQPIPYATLCPLQLATSGKQPNDVFGYQRPWYEYVSKLDTVHGDMRTNLRNFLVNRVFSTAPSLTESFLLVDEKQVNDIFQVTTNTDKIIGQCYFDCKVELPIHRVAIGRLD